MSDRSAEQIKALERRIDQLERDKASLLLQLSIVQSAQRLYALKPSEPLYVITEPVCN